MTVNPYPWVPIQHLAALEPLVKCREEKSTRLRPNTLEGHLRLDNKHAIEIPGIDSLLEMRLFLPDKMVEATQGMFIAVVEEEVGFLLTNVISRVT